MAAHITLNQSDEEEECNVQDYLAAFTISGIDIDDTGIKKALKEFNDMDNDIVTDFFHISLSDLVDLFLDDSDKQAVLIENDTDNVEKKKVNWNHIHCHQIREKEMNNSRTNAHDSAATKVLQDVPVMYRRQAPYSEATQPQSHQQQQSTYLDYSRISDSEALSYFRKSTSLRGKNQEPFPMKLHKILNQSETNLHYASIISWLPHGRAFIIHDTTRFVSEIMPRYFFQTLWSSFMRQVNV